MSERKFQVLINHEEQHALFPTELPVPDGWREAGFGGTEDECVEYVDRTWTDMTPLSLRADG